MLTPEDLKQMEQIATNVYQKLGSRFGVNQTPIHTHNNTDSPNLSPAALTNTKILSAASGGVLEGLTVGNIQPPVIVYPVPTITSLIAGVLPTGTAPEGTVMLKTVDNNNNSIMWYVGGKWRGVNVSSVGTVTGLF